MPVTRHLPDAPETWRRRGAGNFGANGRHKRHGECDRRTKSAFERSDVFPEKFDDSVSFEQSENAEQPSSMIAALARRASMVPLRRYGAHKSAKRVHRMAHGITTTMWRHESSLWPS